jgi:hypothetical protein
MMNRSKKIGLAAGAVGLVLAEAAFAQSSIRGQMPREMPC